ncbi:small ribosomal subunit protein bS6m [Neocloeon triangulifer]|uniref:small ribosomal subunit protein bS6m n=1 Tax=Neocloeon triangulifer TaxID=2078957 RepID=UPI00286F9AEE|nr:small ribosomal subunit protein bS6m [Neocloeon triangulifer]
MPTYELAFLLKNMTKPELAVSMKRAAQEIFNRGGFIRKMENLGISKETPYKISSHGQVHRTASYFAVKFDIPPSTLDDLKDSYQRDVDIVRYRIYKVEEPPKFECTLHEENLPPAYRKDVQQLIAESEKNKPKQWDAKSGLDYYPFQR